MLKKYSLLIGLLLLPATLVSAATLSGTCAVKFFADSTLHKFAGQGACEPFTWTTQTTDGGREVIRAAVVRVPVTGLDTDNGSRNKNMYAMFDAQQYPQIEGRFGELDPAALLQQLGSGSTSEPVRFELTIRSITRPVQAVISSVKQTPDQVDLVAEFPLSLQDFELKPPSVLGLIRVADQLRVRVEVTLQGDALALAATVPAQ